LRNNRLKRLAGSLYAPELVSLLLGGNSIQYVPASFLRSFPKLRVLDLSFGLFDSLPEELGDLKELVSLDLSHCDVKFLPNSIGKLHVLKCLSLFSCQKLNYLPSGVVGLTSLQVLNTKCCCDLMWAECKPSGMARAELLGQANPTRAAVGRYI
jgi:Leucine-rich repeat (LRR) protein